MENPESVDSFSLWCDDMIFERLNHPVLVENRNCVGMEVNCTDWLKHSCARAPRPNRRDKSVLFSEMSALFNFNTVYLPSHLPGDLGV